jgi:hypothetical protein
MRLPQERAGGRLTVKNKIVPFSIWPMKEARRGRYRLQSLLFSLDPWAIIIHTIVAECPNAAKAEALACIDQARDFFSSSSQAGVLEARPLTLYYSYMNLVKAFCLTRGISPSFDKAQHGLSEQLRPNGIELTGAYLRAFPSPSPQHLLQNFAEFYFALTGSRMGVQQDFDLPSLLPQVVPGHRLWALASGRQERFVSVYDIRFEFDYVQKHLWLKLYLVAEDLTRLGVSHKKVLNEARLAPYFREVATTETAESEKALVCFEQCVPEHYSGYPSDRLNELIHVIRPMLWLTVSTTSPYRRYYLYLCPANELPTLLPQMLSIYAISYYLGSITRYRPHQYPLIVKGPFGPRIQDFITGQPLQFLYLMASEFARQDVTKPAIL